MNRALKNASPAQRSTLDQQMVATPKVAASELPAVVANTQKEAQSRASGCGLAPHDRPADAEGHSGR
jgi:hypothetical protein